MLGIARAISFSLAPQFIAGFAIGDPQGNRFNGLPPPLKTVETVLETINHPNPAMNCGANEKERGGIRALNQLLQIWGMTRPKGGARKSRLKAG